MMKQIQQQQLLLPDLCPREQVYSFAYRSMNAILLTLVKATLVARGSRLHLYP